MKDLTLLSCLRNLLLLEQSRLDNLTHREERWPTLNEAIAYRTGRVEAYKEIIEFLVKG